MEKVNTITDSPHPEKCEGEVYLCNATDESFQDIGWKSKRRGVQAYKVDGTPIKHEQFFSLSPVFVSRAELEEAGFTIVEASTL